MKNHIRSTIGFFILFTFTICFSLGDTSRWLHADNNGERVEIDGYYITTQPIQDYNFSFKKYTVGKDGKKVENAIPFLTRIGTDYGPVGTEKRHMHWLPCGQIKVEIKHEGQYAGFWHSLHGLAKEKTQGLNFQAVYPPIILNAYQPKIIGAYIKVKGNGTLKLVLKIREGKKRREKCFREASIKLRETRKFKTLVWPHFVEDREKNFIILDDSENIKTSRKIEWDVSKIKGFKPISLLNWIAETQGTCLIIDEFGFVVAFPMDSQYSQVKGFFLKSLAKLSFCYSSQTGLVKDRANFSAGAMDNVPTSGMYCLSLAAAQSLDIVAKKDAEEVLKKVHAIVSNTKMMPRASGLLPHFVKRKKKKNIPLGEYSTVDTALYYHGMLFAAHILEQKEIYGELIKDIKTIDFDYLTFSKLNDAEIDGYVTMGIKLNGKERLKTDDRNEKLIWNRWGGEGALVMCLKKMAGGKEPFIFWQPLTENANNIDVKRRNKKKEEKSITREVYEGRGFIAEIQSLFYPHFNQDRPDELTKTNWLKSRLEILKDQIECTGNYFSDSEAAKKDKVLYGYSSGEIDRPVWGKTGNDRFYLENGTQRREKPMGVLFPHYILMSSCTDEPMAAIAKLNILESKGFFPPWGLVENVDVHLKKGHPIISSLNASFEAISAYHLFCKVESKKDTIYETAKNAEIIREAIALFYSGER